MTNETPRTLHTCASLKNRIQKEKSKVSSLALEKNITSVEVSRLESELEEEKRKSRKMQELKKRPKKIEECGLRSERKNIEILSLRDTIMGKNDEILDIQKQKRYVTDASEFLFKQITEEKMALEGTIE